MKNKQEKLKPCPFCGSEGKKFEDSKHYRCSNEDCFNVDAVATLKEWNTRPTSDFERIKISQEEFLKHLQKATEIVKSWPKWKQEVLGDVIPDEDKEPLNCDTER